MPRQLYHLPTEINTRELQSKANLMVGESTHTKMGLSTKAIFTAAQCGDNAKFNFLQAVRYKATKGKSPRACFLASVPFSMQTEPFIKDISRTEQKMDLGSTYMERASTNVYM